MPIVTSTPALFPPDGGAAPRPTADALWHVERREVEGGPWTTLARGGGPRAAWDEVLAAEWAEAPGDLARLRRPDGAVHRFAVATGPGAFVEPGGVDERLGQGADWARAWEGAVSPRDMAAVAASAGVDRARLVLAACACAEDWLYGRGRAAEKQAAADALGAARRWALGEGPRPPHEPRPPVQLAPWESALRAAAAPEEAWGRRLAAAAVGAAASRGGTVEARAARRRALVPRVLRWVPLSALLLARAGLPAPITRGAGR